jgi:DNA-binding transcriptional regulator GbsR (MarR family)
VIRETSPFVKNNLSGRISVLLNSCPHGLTSAEIAARLGTTTGKVSSPLSKLAAYGVIRRTWGRPAANERPKAIYGKAAAIPGADRSSSR